MSHRPQDTYPYVATQTIKTGMVTAFNEGDPVPQSTADDMGYVDSGLVVTRAEWENRPETEPEQPVKRGEMPPHLRDKTAKETSTTKSGESATAKSARAGGSSTKKPEPDKSGGK